MTDLPFSLDRDIVICASRDTVFRYFTDSERWARWWGPGSRIDPRPGGEILIVYPGGRTTAQGTVLEVQAPERIVFTYGYDRADMPIPPGGSRVTITVSEVPGGTRVQLRHDVASMKLRDEHANGWRYQMGVFGHVVTAEHEPGLSELLDRWFAVWSARDGRRVALLAICAEDVVYRDRFGFTCGLDDLDGHIGAAQQHLPGAIARDGEARFALGMAIADWTASGAKGTSVFELAPDGRIARVTGFWT